MDSKELMKAAKALKGNFEGYRHYIIKHDIDDLNHKLEQSRKDTIEYFTLKWTLGIINRSLQIEECAKMLSDKNLEAFKKIYPNIYNKRQYSLDDKRVAMRLGLSESSIKSKKLAIFRELVEIQNKTSQYAA